MAKIETLPSGKKRVRIYYTDADGKAHYKSIQGETAKEVRRKAAEWQLQHEREKKSSITLREAYQRYIDTKSNTLAPATLHLYRSAMDTDFQELMDIPIDNIKEEDVQIAVNRYAAYLAPKTVKNKYGQLLAVMNTYRQGFVFRITLPERKKVEVAIPSESEIKTLYQAVKGTHMELPFLLASQLGMRAGEICGLTRADIRDDEILIRHAMTSDGYIWLLKAPKTFSGNRNLPCHPSIIKKLRAATPYRQDIIPGADLALGLSCKDVSNGWKVVQRKTGIKVRFHALRHYYASRALLQGVQRQYIIELMGHRSTRMIDMVYAHTFPEAKKEQAQKMFALVDDLLS